MTPNDLYTLLGLGMSAVTASALLCYAALRIPRVWRAAAKANPVPALTWISVAGLVLYVLRSLAFDPPWPVRLHEPITCSHSCGWSFYYTIVIGALQFLATACFVVMVTVALALILSVLAWLEKPVAPDREDVTNGVQVRRQWRIWRLERDVIKTLTAKVSNGGEKNGVRVTRQSTLIEPAAAVTSIRISPAPEDFDDVAETLTAHPLIDSVDVIPDSERELGGAQLRVRWDLMKIDFPPTHHTLPDRRVSRRAGLTVGVAAVAVVAAAFAMTSPQPAKSHTSTPALPPVPAAPVSPDQLVPFTMSEDACSPRPETPDECGPDGHDGQQFTLNIDGRWMIHQVGFNPSALVPGRVVTRVRWSFGDPEPAGTEFEQDVRDPSHSPDLRYEDPPASSSVTTFVAFLRSGGYLTSHVTVTVLDSTPASGVDPSSPRLDGGGDLQSHHLILMYGHPEAVSAECQSHASPSSSARGWRSSPSLDEVPDSSTPPAWFETS